MKKALTTLTLLAMLGAGSASAAVNSDNGKFFRYQVTNIESFGVITQPESTDENYLGIQPLGGATITTGTADLEGSTYWTTAYSFNVTQDVLYSPSGLTMQFNALDSDGSSLAGSKTEINFTLNFVVLFKDANGVANRVDGTMECVTGANPEGGTHPSLSLSLSKGSTGDATTHYTWTENNSEMSGSLDVEIYFAPSDAAAAYKVENYSMTGYAKDKPVAPVEPETPSESAPEPTTATLSLLALAGLAARRRRK